MADVFTKAKRSAVMARIRSRGNERTELALAKLFRAAGITGWRRQMQIRAGSSRGDGAQTSLGGRKAESRASSRRLLRVRPDFVFPGLRLAVFVDGCFWHGCPRHATRPKINAAFWRRKFAANIARDRRVNRGLRAAGWTVLRIWECALTRRRAARTLRRITRVWRRPGHDGSGARVAARSRPVPPSRRAGKAGPAG